MNRGFGILWVVAATAAAAPGAQLAREVTAEEAIALALKQNRDLAAVRFALETSRLGLAGAENEFRYTLKPEGSAGASDAGTSGSAGLAAGQKLAWGTELSAAARVGEAVDDDLENRYEGSVKIEVRQPLFRNRGREANLDPVFAARAEVLSARRRFEEQKASLLLQVVEKHLALARLQSQVTYDEESFRRLDQLRRLTEAKEKQGRATRVDTLRVDFDRGRAESRLAQTREQLASARQDLADLLAEPIDTEFVAVPGPVLEVTLPPPAEAVAVALSNRLDYADALQAIREAARGTRVARQNLGPNLGLLTRYERLGDGDTLSDAADLREERWFFGLSAGSDLLRREEKLALGRQMILEESVEEQRAALASAVAREVNQAILACRRARQEAGFAQRNFELVRDRTRLARRLFEIGRGDNFAVTDAESQLFQAQSQLLQSRADVTLSAYRLLRAMGTLVEAPPELKPAAMPEISHSRGTPKTGTAADAENAEDHRQGDPSKTQKLPNERPRFLCGPLRASAVQDRVGSMSSWRIAV